MFSPARQAMKYELPLLFGMKAIVSGLPPAPSDAGGALSAEGAEGLQPARTRLSEAIATMSLFISVMAGMK